MVKLKYRGPNTGQPAASVTCKPMKSLRQQPEIIRKGKWRIAANSGRNSGQVVDYADEKPNNVESNRGGGAARRSAAYSGRLLTCGTLNKHFKEVTQAEVTICRP